MKHFITFSLISLIMISCNRDSDHSIIGKWQSTSNENITVEFTEDGDYIFCVNSNCTDDQNHLQYQYDRSSSDFNLKFKASENDESKHLGKLSFKESNKIDVELYSLEKKLQSKKEFTRLF